MDIETLEYRGVLRNEGTIVVCSAWDDAGNLNGAKAPEGYWRNTPMTWETSGGYCLTQRWL